MPSQAEKGETFRALHMRDSAFIIPNPWDPGTARILEHLGFESLATTSAGYAFSLGKRDGAVGRDAMLAHVAELTSATLLPVSADLENGFGHAPEAAAESIRLGAEAGLVGGSIEDYSNDASDSIYEVAHAADRVRAAAEAAHSVGFPFMLTARAENYLHGKPDLADTITRLQAYQEAGADVLYAPGLLTRDDIGTLVRSVDRPVNVVMGLRGAKMTLGELSALGVRRVSVGSALSRAALGAFIRGATELREHGTFRFADDAVGTAEVVSLLGA